VNTLDP